MSEDTRISILICKDAGAASRTLLAREDLRIRWALTAAEAEAVIKLTKCGVCVTRASLAKGATAACLTADREIASIVLLERERWSSWREYFDAGATAVLQAEGDQVLDAMFEATGVSFRTAPRVPYKTEVKLASDERGSWSTIDLSTAGLSVLGFPLQALGAQVELRLDLDGILFPCKATVARISRSKSRHSIGLAFNEPSPPLLARIEDVIDTAQTHLVPVAEPDEPFDALDDETVTALRTSAVGADSFAIARALTAGGKVAGGEAAEPWLIAACDAFTTIEVSAIQEPQSAPAWVHDAVLGRLRAYKARSLAGGSPPADQAVREVFGLCQRLADSSAGSDPATLVQVTNLRADILRALYTPELIAVV